MGKKLIFQSFVGICFGALIAVLMYTGFYATGAESFDAALFIKNSAASIFCGWFFSVGALIFTFEHWTLRKRTIVHFFIVTSLYFILGIGIGWFPLTFAGLLFGVLLFLIVYVLIWTGCYLYFYFQAKKLNDSLNA
ncbi:hypothetical protein AAV35_008150 [Salimicrobium jeotgali]|uniref:DUF3021 domain-containing protein n=2 Tax=Salimicrobium jeotgali TaxID=1230341 RepID=K2FL72_9BACI|nr:DUF3021 domain-containing protein [Salimicrobium jeotgali]AKG04776.1 hypothetical protein AAV35_008150 [Salimicrobium jeotgali]EKE31716.1 hypothetical protein MJ3_06243 [Salimicrobium jeotgali]MBM7696325.1 O-antigen ligase [Salimicrobium jeotgali]